MAWQACLDALLQERHTSGSMRTLWTRIIKYFVQSCAAVKHGTEVACQAQVLPHSVPFLLQHAHWNLPLMLRRQTHKTVSPSTNEHNSLPHENCKTHQESVQWRGAQYGLLSSTSKEGGGIVWPLTCISAKGFRVIWVKTYLTT